MVDFRRQGLIALDIETTGLDPRDAAVVAVALVADARSEVLSGAEERQILARLEKKITESPDDLLLVTWNGDEFDLPFLRARYDALEIPSQLQLQATGARGKYGGPLFTASWGKRGHVDIAPYFKESAAKLGVSWSLKPVAKAMLGVKPVEVDRSGEAIAAMDQDRLREYVLSDASITHQLARLLRRDSADGLSPTCPEPASTA